MVSYSWLSYDAELRWTRRGEVYACFVGEVIPVSCYAGLSDACQFFQYSSKLNPSRVLGKADQIESEDNVQLLCTDTKVGGSAYVALSTTLSSNVLSM